MKTTTVSRLALCLVLSLPMAGFAASQTSIYGPAGSDDFGSSITVLPNGNFVVVDAAYDQPSPALTNAGAVYLYSPKGVLISRLVGGAANNEVGSGGVQVLSNGNFIVRSNLWDNTSPAATDAGAVTFGNATTGFGALSVVVSAANSLVGSTLNDHVGEVSVATLPNGNYVVLSPGWNVPSGAADVGAATFCSGTTGFAGAISASNSLIGSTANDQVGLFGVTALTNGHYVVNSPLWDIPAGAVDVGAVTWCRGTNGFPFGSSSKGAVVSTTNSVTGTRLNDKVGNNGIVALPNGNYLAGNSDWDDPSGAVDVGAVRYCNGATGASGAITSANALIGVTAGDKVGAFGVTVLTNGHYVVGSPSWSIPAGAARVGAVTWCDGNTGRTGTVTAANSLIGSTLDDQIGGFGIFALKNGNYVVFSSQWDSPTAVDDVGAITWCSGTTTTSAVVSVANSLVGSTSGDSLGSYGGLTLTNGNYVVLSPYWDSPGGIVDVGAATWGNGTTGVKGLVSAANSLVGSSAFDQVSTDGGVALTNGNYVIVTSFWGGPNSPGAVTWGNGSTGTKGVVSASNSLIGKTASDNVGGGFVTALANGNYVVASPMWDDPATGHVNVGAVTFGNGASGVKGFVTAANSLIGSTAEDRVSSNSVEPLTNGNYLVRSPKWDNGPAVDAGALTWGSGTTGVKGLVSTANSLVGGTTDDQIGTSGVAEPDGSFFVSSRKWDNSTPTIVDAGALTFSYGTAPLAGYISAGNSVLGTVAGGGPTFRLGYDPARKQVVVGNSAENRVVILGNQLQTIAKTGVAAPGALDIAFAAYGGLSMCSSGAVMCDYTLTGAGSSGGKNRAVFDHLYSTDPLELMLQTGSNVSALGAGLPSNTKVLTLTNPLYQLPGLALIQATVSGTGITTTNNKLLIADDGSNLTLVRRTGQPIGVGTLARAVPSAFGEVLQCHFQDLFTVGYTLKADAVNAINASNDSGLLMVDHNGIVKSNILAREGEPAFGGGGTFGQFSGRATAPITNVFFTSTFKPTTGASVNALFSMTVDGATTSRIAKVGDVAGGLAPDADAGVPTFASFTGVSQLFSNVMFKATLAGGDAAKREGLWVGTTAVLRKGRAVSGLPGVLFGSIVRFWPAGTDQAVAQVTLTGAGVTKANDSALILCQADGNHYVLMRTGSTPPGVDAARISAISAVDVSPASGRYVVLTALTNAPASANQALWTGFTAAGNDTTLQAQRLPIMRLRKGDLYGSTATPQGVIKGLTLKPAVDASGAGGRGLAQCISQNGDVAVYILGDRSLTELVVLTVPSGGS